MGGGTILERAMEGRRCHELTIQIAGDQAPLHVVTRVTRANQKRNAAHTSQIIPGSRTRYVST